MKKLLAEQDNQKERNSYGLMGALILVVAVLLVVQVVIANRLVEAADKLRDLDEAISAAERQNDTLAEELRGRESLSAISAEALKMGFSKEVKTAYLLGADKPMAFGGKVSP